MSIAAGSGTAAGSGAPSSPARTANPGTVLGTGLQSNLERLDSFQFTETLSAVTAAGGTSAGASPSPALVISGTVINTGQRSLWINDAGAQYIVIGDQAWSSLDGTAWYTATPNDASFASLLPGAEYSTWFNGRAASFRTVGEEARNGVQCLRYKGDDSLSGVAASGGTTLFRAELWISKSGGYPVSGVFGTTDGTGAISGGSGYSFDVTHINDPANKVTAPANVVPLPS